MMAKDVEQRRAYDRAYYAANIEKLRARSREYRRKLREEKPEEVRAKKRAWCAANPAKVAAADARHRARHIDKVKARKKKYYELNKPRIRVRRRAYQGLPAPTRPEPMFCECCSRPAGARGMHLDHCHKTNLFRGWLCGNCNSGMGMFGDSIPALYAAIGYLRRYAPAVVESPCIDPRDQEALEG